MRFPKDFPEKLRSSILVSEVVGKKVKLKLRGKEFTGLCPFHNEKSPSFTVNDLKGFYHCFGCAAHGDVISFVMKNDGLEYVEAVTKLANDFGIPIPQVKFDEVLEDKLSRDLQILENICQFFEQNLISENGKTALAYLRKREIASETIKKFRLGFAPNSYESLTKFLKGQGFTDQEIARTGVIGLNDKKNFYDKFRNRVIFPITNKKGLVIAFGGRTIGEDMPKYLNSSETDLFKKNRTLYNFHFARKPIFTKGFAVVVEGYMDAISLFKNGVENVVAGLGTALGQEHLKELFFTTDRVVICLDGDDAGVRAAKRFSELALPLINAKKNVAFAFLPDKLDPDDFIKKFGAKELEKVFASATPLSESLFDFALMELGVGKGDKISAEIKAKIEGNLALKIAAIIDPTSKKYFSYFFKDLLFSLGRNVGRSFGGKNNQKPVENFGTVMQKNFTKVASSALKIQAQSVIALIIKFPELANFRDDDFDVKEAQFASEDLTSLKESIIDLIEENPEVDEKILISTLEKSSPSNDLTGVKNILASISSLTLDSARIKLSTLLLKDLLLQVDLQYKEVLSKIDEIETHQTAVTNQKIKEIFEYKNSLERRIVLLEKELT